METNGSSNLPVEIKKLEEKRCIADSLCQPKFQKKQVKSQKVRKVILSKYSLLMIKGLINKKTMKRFILIFKVAFHES